MTFVNGICLTIGSAAREKNFWPNITVFVDGGAVVGIDIDDADDIEAGGIGFGARIGFELCLIGSETKCFTGLCKFASFEILTKKFNF